MVFRFVPDRIELMNLTREVAPPRYGLALWAAPGGADARGRGLEARGGRGLTAAGPRVQAPRAGGAKIQAENPSEREPRTIWYPPVLPFIIACSAVVVDTHLGPTASPQGGAKDHHGHDLQAD